MTKVYVGTYTEVGRGGRGQGIYVYDLDRTTGAMTLEQMVEGDNPHFFALHPTLPIYYVTHGGAASRVSAYAIDEKTGHLTLINTQPSAGFGPTHLDIDPSGRVVVVANYREGNIAAFGVKPDGRLTPATDVHQHGDPADNADDGHAGPTPHVVAFDKSGKFVLICDMGMNATYIYQVDAVTAKLTPHDPPTYSAALGAGPRHLAFHPNGTYAYVINEFDSSIVTHTWDSATGTLRAIQSVPMLPPRFAGKNNVGEIVVARSGRFVYGSNRGHDSIAIFSVDPSNGTLTPIGHESSVGKGPRHFEFDPTGRFVFAGNEVSDDVVSFFVDTETGMLRPTGHQVPVGTPYCVVAR